MKEELSRGPMLLTLKVTTRFHANTVEIETNVAGDLGGQEGGKEG